HQKALRIVCIPQPMFTTSMIGDKVILAAILPIPIPFPKREATVNAEVVSVCRNERNVMLRDGAALRVWFGLVLSPRTTSELNEFLELAQYVQVYTVWVLS